MRSPIVTSPKGLRARDTAGTYVVLLAFDCDPSYATGLLGFAIERHDHTNDEQIWLRGLKRFDLPSSDDGNDVSTRNHPIQKFHWGDYTTKAGRTYTYTIHAMRGKAGALADSDSVSFDVTCENPDQVGKNGHAVHFNRSAAASQAFANRIPNLPPGDVTDPNARVWLSRGLAEALIAFIDGTQKGEGLHLFVYEFTKPEYLDALKRAKGRGVKLEILFDSIVTVVGGKKTGPSIESKPAMKKYGLTSVAKGRTGAGINISHNKFMVRTDVSGKATAVWTGSTNWTDGGVYGQTNVGHAIHDAALAEQYFTWHQAIWKKPDDPAPDSRVTAMGDSPLPGALKPGTTLVLSPRKTIEAVTECANLATGAGRMVCFTAPFPLHKDLQAALTKSKAHVFGLLNKDGVVGPELHAAPNTQLAAAASLSDKSVLEAWQKQLLAESMHHSGVYIHTKIMIFDPLSATPMVVTGSANFSLNSSENNDENQLFVSGEAEVADVYLGEFMRMWDHYYFRNLMAQQAKAKKVDPKVAYLDPTDGWAKRFFGTGERVAARISFWG
jgi:phosphatidylserine/phosphatidylglycerophosphate/cardiolipin synthase-like enzyme